MLRDRFLGAALQGRASQRLALVLEGQILDAGDGILRRHAEIVDELTVSPLGQRLVLQFRHQEPIRRAVIVIGPAAEHVGQFVLLILHRVRMVGVLDQRLVGMAKLLVDRLAEGSVRGGRVRQPAHISLVEEVPDVHPDLPQRRRRDPRH